MIHELVIVGAGPGGLFAAHAAQRKGWRSLVVDRSDGVGGVWSRVPGDMLCLSERRRDRFPDGTTPAGEGERAQASDVLEALKRFASGLQAELQLGVSATGLSRAPSGVFTVTLGDRAVETQRVLIATGEYDRPVYPPAATDGIHSSQFDPSSVAPGAHVVVVGARASASDLVPRLLARGCQVTLSTRGPLLSQGKARRGLGGELLWRASGLPTRLLPRSLRCSDAILPVEPILEEARDSGALRVVGAAVALGEGGVTVAPEGWIAADHVVFATGYRRDIEWLGAPAVAEDGAPAQREGLSTTVPGLGFVGIPCMRTRRSGFLRGLADDARAVVEGLA